MSYTRHTDMAEIDIETQIRFELSCIEEGARKAREALMEQGLADSVVGMKMTRRIIKPLIQQIELAQEEAALGVVNLKRGRPVGWWLPISTIDKHKLAVIILNAVFSVKPRDGTLNLAVSRVASAIASRAYEQIDYDRWEKEQKALKRTMKADAEKTGEKVGWTDLERFIKSNKQIDAQRWKKFQERIERVKDKKWTHEQGIIFGVKCLDLLVQAKPEWFSVSTNAIQRGRFETQLSMTEECKDVMFDLVEEQELASPRFLPMIKPPAPWRKTQGVTE